MVKNSQAEEPIMWEVDADGRPIDEKDQEREERKKQAVKKGPDGRPDRSAHLLQKLKKSGVQPSDTLDPKRTKKLDEKVNFKARPRSAEGCLLIPCRRLPSDPR